MTNRVGLLTGLARCYCGVPLELRQRTSGENVYRCPCRDHRVRPLHFDHPAVVAVHVDRMVTDLAASYIERPGWFEKMWPDMADIATTDYLAGLLRWTRNLPWATDPGEREAGRDQLAELFAEVTVAPPGRGKRVDLTVWDPHAYNFVQPRLTDRALRADLDDYHEANGKPPQSPAFAAVPGIRCPALSVPHA